MRVTSSVGGVYLGKELSVSSVIVGFFPFLKKEEEEERLNVFTETSRAVLRMFIFQTT